MMIVLLMGVWNLVLTKIDELSVDLYGILPFFSKEELSGFGSKVLHLLLWRMLVVFFSHFFQSRCGVSVLLHVLTGLALCRFKF